jgi:serine/threonine protein kinase
MRLERTTLERSTSLGSRFLTTLRYAFRQGPWLVLAMPLITGGTLQVQIEERAATAGGFSEVEMRWAASQIICALGAIHSLGLIHRDVKPTNLILRPDGYYVLTDFGLSEAPGVATKTGTRGYWSPETIRQEAQTAAADWWSAGVVLLYAASGVHPFYVAQDGVAAVDDFKMAADDRAVESPEKVVPGPSSPEHRVPDGTVGMLAAEGTDADGAGSFTSAMIAAERRRQAKARRKAKTAQRRKYEAQVNAKSLEGPITFRSRCGSKALHQMLAVLVERDVSKRLADADAARQLEFVSNVEWSLLEGGWVPAPFTPSSELVYVPDDVSPLSFLEEEAEEAEEELEERGSRLGLWDFQPERSSPAFAEELTAYASKYVANSAA